MTWRKSSFSLSNGACIEVDTNPWRKPFRSVHNGACFLIRSWRKSSKSIVQECVEAGTGEAVVGVRDSKLGDDSPVLEFSPAAWREFTNGVKAL